jgi:hypothetical protein
MSSIRRAAAGRNNAREAGVLAPDVNEQAYRVGEWQFTEEISSQLLLVRTSVSR